MSTRACLSLMLGLCTASLFCACSWGNTYPKAPQDTSQQLETPKATVSPQSEEQKDSDVDSMPSLLAKSRSNRWREIPPGARAVMAAYVSVPENDFIFDTGEQVQTLESIESFDRAIKRNRRSQQAARLSAETKQRNYQQAKRSNPSAYARGSLSRPLDKASIVEATKSPSPTIYTPETQSKKKAKSNFTPSDKDLARLGSIAQARRAGSSAKRAAPTVKKAPAPNLPPAPKVITQPKTDSSSLPSSEKFSEEAATENQLSDTLRFALAVLSHTLSKYSFFKELLILAVIVAGYFLIIGIRLEDRSQSYKKLK